MTKKNRVVLVGGIAALFALALAPLAAASGSGDSPDNRFTQPNLPAMSVGATATDSLDATTLAVASASPTVKPAS